MDCAFNPPRIYKYLKSGEGRRPEDVLELSEPLLYTETKNFIVRNESNNTFLYFDSYFDYASWFRTNPKSRCLHEVILGPQPQKLKFDIDAEMAELDQCISDEVIEEYMDSLEQEQFEQWDELPPAERKIEYYFKHFLFYLESILMECFETSRIFALEIDPRFAYSDSSDEFKFSRHVVCRNYCVENNVEAAMFTQILCAKMPEYLSRFIDVGVNSSIQNFRLPKCTKLGSHRVKRVIWGSNEDMVVTYVPCCELICLKPEYIHPVQSYSDSDDDELFDTSAVLDVISAANVDKSHRFTKRVGNLFLFKRLHASDCEFCGREHTKDNTQLVRVSQKGNVYLHCRRSKDKRFLGKIRTEVETTKAAEPESIEAAESIETAKAQVKVAKVERVLAPLPALPEPPAEFEVDKYDLPHIKPFSLKNHDALLIKSGMGTGKTKQLIDYILGAPKGCHVVIVSFRRSFTSEIVQRLNEKGLNFVDYRSVTGEIKDSHVVVQFESLHRLKLPIGQKCLVVLDETESVIGQMENRHNQKFTECWEKFEWLINHGTKLIAMDAMAGARTFELLKARKSVLMQWNTAVSQLGSKTLKDFYYAFEATFFDAVYKSAENAKVEPIVICSSSKNVVDILGVKLRQKHSELNIKLYSSDSTAADRQDFENVNDAWAGVDILLYTSTVSAGCSFERTRFTKLFGYFTDRSVDYQTAIQMMGRVRDISSGEHHIFVNSSYGDFPDTQEAIERTMATQAEIADLEVNPLGLPRQINATGEYQWRVKDLYYKLHVGNLLHRCQSRNRFADLFKQLRRVSGVAISTVNEKLSEKATQEITSEIVSIAADNRKCRYFTIANAMPIEQEDAEKLAKQDTKTPEESASLESYHLAKTYDICQENLTPEFVEKYNNSKTKQIYHNLCNLQSADFVEDSQDPQPSLLETLNKYRTFQQRMKEHRQGNSSMADLTHLERSEGMIKSMFALDMLNVLTNGQYQNFTKFQELPELPRETVEKNIDAAIDILQKHSDTVSVLFEITRTRLKAPRTNLRGKLDLVNSITNGAFNVKIVGSTRTKKGAESFRITAPAEFEWRDGRYSPDMNLIKQIA